MSAPALSPQLAPGADPEIELLLPANDVAEPELSIVVPALNEELTIADFVAWCHEGMRKARHRRRDPHHRQRKDRTNEIALAGGARVLRTPKRGLGRAYIDALPYIRGRYVLMGDCDCTYDFRELAPFVEKFRGGRRVRHGIAVQGLHRARLDAAAAPVPRHAGDDVDPQRHLRQPVLRHPLRHARHHQGRARRACTCESQSWEYASEMVLKSVHMQLRTEEVPVRFLKDREGRVSHHKRSGWFSPWQAAWINLRAMFVYGADFFLYKPGLRCWRSGCC